MLIATTKTHNSHWVIEDADGTQHIACAPTKPMPKNVVTIAEQETRHYADGTPFKTTPVCHRCNGVNWH